MEQTPTAEKLECTSERLSQSHCYHDIIVLENFLLKMFSIPSTLKRKVGVFNFLGFEERSRSSVFVTD